jgi:hypothetical protein
MTNHPIHLHGHAFVVAGTDGGWTNPASRWPEVTTDIAVGQMRAIEFIADNPGDWALHCHKSHHTMNAMGHDVPTMIGVDHSKVAEQISHLIPGYMVMGDKGGSMSRDGMTMQMPLPANTLPMMTGAGPYGPIEMGGMFTTLKVRAGLARNDYQDPGDYAPPKGTVAYLLAGDAPEVERQSESLPDGSATATSTMPEMEMKVRKPMDHRHQ